MLEARTRAKVLELGLHHRAKVARGVMAELYDAARVALEHEDHSAPDLGSRNCHPQVTLENWGLNADSR
jgi:hypothetical protein